MPLQPDTLLVYYLSAVVVVLVGLLVFWVRKYYKREACIYDEAGKCRECRHPRSQRPNDPHGDSYEEIRHHPNCPIGRLGL
jgi:hypothetical protein